MTTKSISSTSNKGFTLIELLIVIAIIGILAAAIMAVAMSSRNKADDVRVKNSVRQLRWLAEIVYDEQGGSFVNWSSHSDIAGDFAILMSVLTDVHGSPLVSIGETEIQNFCVSSPLKSNSSKYYCIDASRELTITDSPCPSTTTPHVCP